MESMTLQKFIHTSPRKLRLVADMVRKMEPEKAVEILRFTNKAAARDLSNAVLSAMSNAKGVDVLPANLINAYEIIKHNNLLITKEAVDKLAAAKETK